VSAVLLLTGGIGLGMYFEHATGYVENYYAYSTRSQNGTLLPLDTKRIADAWVILQQNFLNSDQLNPEKALFGAIRGMVSASGDPYTSFFDPDEAKLFLSDTEGSFEGIGAEIGMRKNIITVIAPIHGTPAERSGLRAGDMILQIDEMNTADLTVDQAVANIRGPKGTSVKLLIVREDNEPFTVEITRDRIDIPALKLSYKENIAHIELYNFSQKAGQEFNEAAQDILSKNPRGIILDVRNNPGGYLDMAIEIAGWFLVRDTPVVIEEDRGGNRITDRSTGTGQLKDYPLIVLINEGSASASEILAGALADTLHIRLVGEKSYGKGSVQSLETLSDGSALKITVAKWLTPSGISISDEGIRPDIVVEQTAEDEEKDRDPQFEKAKELLLQSL